MRVLVKTCISAILALLLAVPAEISGQSLQGAISGDIVDESGGVIPGVTVVATSGAGDIVATTVTNDVGRFALEALPSGVVTVTFELEGFETVSVTLIVQPGVESSVHEHLALAPMSENVVVYGKAPVDPPQPQISRRPPASVLTPVAAHEMESVCGPAKPGATRESFGTIRSHRYETERVLYRLGDELTIEGGTENGLEVGANLVARRYYRAIGPAGVDTKGEHTAGVVQIVATTEQTANAVVIHACNELMQGDVLAAFRPEAVAPPEPIGIPSYRDAARILFPDAGQIMGVARRMMVIDQGHEQGIRAGQRLTLFRISRGENKRLVVGEAVVLAVRTDSARIRVESATDVIWSGDWAAPQRPMPETQPLARYVER